MDFQAAIQTQVFRDEIQHFGAQSNFSLLSDFPFSSISSFDDLGRFLSKNYLLGDDGGAILLSSEKQPHPQSSSNTITTDQASLSLQRYLQLHALTWANAIVRVVIPKSKFAALVDVNKELSEARQKTSSEGGADSSDSGAVYRVGVVRSVHFALPKVATDQKAPAAPTGPSATVADFVADYLSKILFFTIDFGDCVDPKFAVKFVSNDQITAAEFTTLVSAVAGPKRAHNNGDLTSAVTNFFREPASTTQMRLYPCRLVKQGTKVAIPSRKYPASINRSFVGSEPQLKSVGALHLTRTLQQLLTLQGADGLSEASVDEANGDETASTSHTLTYKELSVLMSNVVAPELARLNQMLIEQEVNGGSSSTGGNNSNFTELSESRRELFGVQQDLKRANQKSASLQEEVDKLQAELQNEKSKIAQLAKLNDQLRNLSTTQRERSEKTQRLFTESRAMLNLNENASPDEVLSSLRRKLGH